MLVEHDLLPNLPSFIRRVCSGYALRPFFGSPEAGVSRLIHNGGLAAPSRSSNVIGAFALSPMRAFFVQGIGTSTRAPRKIAASLDLCESDA
jgi:hypothetical protein